MEDIKAIKEETFSIYKSKFSTFSGEPEKVCSEFGCSKVLTLQEKLFGEKCINHSKKDKPSYFTT